MRKLSAGYRFLCFALFVFTAFSCANVVSPVGGPQDTEPPVVIRSNPPNFSANYKGQNIRIFFNEYVTLKNLRQNQLVSPPISNDPDIRVKGRSIIISIKDTLLPNTTYNFFFGESVVDITEGNAIPNFQFVVSTGEFVDSLSVKGVLKSAESLLPQENVFVMMYDRDNDSLPLLERPVYVSKTNKQGEFRINTMREGKYRMFALKDINSNYIYDNPEEWIAFHDSLVSPYYIKERPVAAARTDSISAEPADNTKVLIPEGILEALVADSINYANAALVDSVAIKDNENQPLYQLFLFKEADTLQKIVSASLVSRGKLNINFRLPAETVTVREYKNPIDGNWFLPEFSRNRDTLSLWINQIERDTLWLEIADRGHIIDSVKVSMTLRQPRTRVTRAQDQEPPETKVNISVSGLIGRNTQPYFSPLQLVSQTPLASVNNKKVEFFLRDTIPLIPEFEILDSVSRFLRLNNRLEQDSSYLITLLPGAVSDIFGDVNDTIRVNFKVNNETAYGTLMIDLKLPQDQSDGQYILQLMDDKFEKIITEKILTNDGVISFPYLNAATFKGRLVFDRNKNGKWDTGNYLRRLQPEKVLIYNSPMQTRLNWEMEFIWDASTP